LPASDAEQEAAGQVAMIEIFHIELLEPDTEGGSVVRRISVRSGSVDTVKDRARRMLQRSQVPPATPGEVGSVRVLNGAGYEVFSMSATD
jgi:hypothetical protein